MILEFGQDKPKLCKDCKYQSDEDDRVLRPQRTLPKICKKYSNVDLVEGHETHMDCYQARNPESCCGPEGKGWEPIIQTTEEIERMYIESQDPVAKPMQPGQTFNAEVIS